VNVRQLTFTLFAIAWLASDIAWAKKPKATAPRAGEPPPSGIMGDPSVVPPSDPLTISPEMRERIGSDWDGRPAGPLEDKVQRRYFPYYEERRADYRLRLLPPFYFEHTRGLPHVPSVGRYNAATQVDRESLFGALYYQRRSPRFDADVLFPIAWRFRRDNEHTLALGPLFHREAPGKHDNWFFPLVFEGARPNGGGYLHLPLLLTFSDHDEKSAFALIGPYFRKRVGQDVELGIAPFFFHGETVTTAGTNKNYTIIPPLAFYHRQSELEGTRTTVAGPVVIEQTPKRNIFNIAPLFFHISGRPEDSGVRESHTTLAPLFHYGYSPEQRLLVTPLFMHRQTPTVNTTITPLYTHSSTRNGATQLHVAGPGLPVFFHFRDRDVDLSRWGLFPLAYHSASPTHNNWLTPLFARFEDRGMSTTTWVFPTIVHKTHEAGSSTDVYPLFFSGRDKKDKHLVFAPFLWEFETQKSHTTIAAPLFWRFADKTDGSVTQLAGNTLYMSKRVPGGTDWEFHFLPLLSFGKRPLGHWWNVLFGLTGYERSGAYSRAKAFWIPFQTSGPSARQVAAASQ
jgi:hypothetical protein